MHAGSCLTRLGGVYRAQTVRLGPPPGLWPHHEYAITRGWQPRAGESAFPA
jgi:hypothetical protein